ncbi:unnamed protein product [Trichobilharzia regenti]|nr:unnamed protein product [Trichobilharzia regenti]
MNNKNKDILSNNPSDILTSNITKHNKSNSHPSSYLPCRNNANNSSSSSTTGRNVKVNELKNKPSSSLGTAYCPQHGILPIVKTAYVYQDNDLDNRSSGIRLAIQPNHYRSLEALLEELTTTVSTVTCNEQKMYAPQVMSKFKSMNDIQSNSYYAYSDYPTKSRGISLDRKTTNKANRTIDYKPSSLSTSTSYSRLVLPSYSLTPSKLDLNNLLNRYTTTDTTNSNKFNKTTNCVYLPTLDTLIVDSDETTTWRQLKQVKRIYVRLNGQPRIYKPVLVRRRYIKKLDQVLQELSELFRIPIHKIYTLDGVLVSVFIYKLVSPSLFDYPFFPSVCWSVLGLFSYITQNNNT